MAGGEQEYNAADFAKAAREAIADVAGKGRLPIVCEKGLKLKLFWQCSLLHSMIFIINSEAFVQ